MLGGGLNSDVLLGGDRIGGNEVVRQVAIHSVGGDKVTVGGELKGDDFYLLFGLLTRLNNIAEVAVRERGFNTVGGVVTHRQADRAGRRDRAVVSKACAILGQLCDQFGLKLGHLGHVLAITGVQNTPRHLIAHFITIFGQLRALAQHFGGNGVLLLKHRRHAFLFREFQRLLPALNRQVAAHFIGEHQ